MQQSMIRIQAITKHVFILVALLATGWSIPAQAGSPYQCLLKHELAHAGGWPEWHPGAIKTKACGELPMPPHDFPLKGNKVSIVRVDKDGLHMHCGYVAQACSTIGGNPAIVWLPK